MTTELWHQHLKLQALKSLRGHLDGLTDDEQAIRDTIEGETDLDALIGNLIALRNEAQAMAEARRALAKRYLKAAGDQEERAAKIEEMIHEALAAASQHAWSGPAGTASIRRGSVACEITDPMQVPIVYQKAEPDKAAIKKALTEQAKCSGMAGKLFEVFTWADLPGARLVRGPDSLMIKIPGSKDADEKGS
jgi:dsDNA-specific endonuclease/ATPase MutS2